MRGLQHGLAILPLIAVFQSGKYGLNFFMNLLKSQSSTTLRTRLIFQQWVMIPIADPGGAPRDQLTSFSHVGKTSSSVSLLSNPLSLPIT